MNIFMWRTVIVVAIFKSNAHVTSMGNSCSHVWHYSLFAIHVFCFIVAFFVGVDLILKHHSVYSVQRVLDAARGDPNAMLVDRTLRDGGGEAETALGDVGSCLIACGAVALLVALLMLFNIYAFLAVILPPDSAAVSTLPGLAKIREQMQEEVHHHALDEGPHEHEPDTECPQCLCPDCP